MSPVRQPLQRGRRLSPQVRRESLLQAAAKLVLDQGALPIGVQELAAAAQVSKALVYRYFPEPQDLYNALLEQSLGRLLAAGVEPAADHPKIDAAAAGAAEVYYRHVAGTGPLIQIILRDRFMAGRVSPAASAMRDRVCRRLARRLRRELRLPVRESVACVSLGMTAPEECGRLVFHGELDGGRGAELCRELVLGVVDVARRRGLEAAS